MVHFTHATCENKKINVGIFSGEIYLNGHRVDKTQFNCPICNLNFSKVSNVREHIKIKHLGKKHDCLLCNKSFSYAGDLRRHTKSIHDGEKHNCPLCDKQFSQSG